MAEVGPQGRVSKPRSSADLLGLLGGLGRLVRDLARWCERHGVARVAELTGTLKTRPRPEKVYA